MMKKIAKEDLLMILRDMIACVEQDDSYEGSIEYSCIHDACQKDEFMVRASYRIGNSEGQGGCRMVGVMDNEEGRPS